MAAEKWLYPHVDLSCFDYSSWIFPSSGSLSANEQPKQVKLYGCYLHGGITVEAKRASDVGG